MKQHILFNVLFILLLIHKQSYAQNSITPGRFIGQVSVAGDLIVIELDSATLGQPKLFDLVGRTLRFKPTGSGYRVTNEPLRWYTNYGVELTSADVRLTRFTFPFSGKRWSSFSVGTAGSTLRNINARFNSRNSIETFCSETRAAAKPENVIRHR